MSLPLPNGLILVVDDDDRFRERLALALRDRGYRTLSARGPTEALALTAGQAPDHAIIDLRMPEGSGLTLLAELLARSPDTQAIVLTGYGSVANAVEAMRLGATGYLQKPADADMVLAAFAPATGGPRSERADYTPPSLARAEWEHIQRVLEDCGGNVSEAARKLGLHRRTLQRKLQVAPPRR